MVGKGKKPVRLQTADVVQADSTEVAITQLSTITIDLEETGELVRTEQGNSKGELSPDLEQPNNKQLKNLYRSIVYNQEYLAFLEQDQELRQQQETIIQADCLLDKIAISITSLIVSVTASVNTSSRRMRALHSSG